MLAIASGIVGVGSVIPYVRDILYGTTRPNAVSVFLWIVLLIISLAAQFSAGISWSAAVLVASMFNMLLILGLCLFGYGYRKYGALDGVCFILAIVGIILWQLAHEPLIAITFALLADFISTVPTLAKTARYPETEDPLAWFLIAFAALLSIAAANKFTAANLLWPVYYVVIDLTVFGLAFFGRRLKTNSGGT